MHFFEQLNGRIDILALTSGIFTSCPWRVTHLNEAKKKI